MKKTAIFPAILGLTLLIAARTPAQEQSSSSEPLTAAVLDFQTTGDDLAKKGADAAILLNAQLSASPSLILVERQDLEKILGEQELGLSGTVDPATAAKIGAITGAKVLITGRIFGSGTKFYAVAKVMSTETSRVYGEVAPFSRADGLEDAITQLAPKISAVVEKRGDTLVAKPEDDATHIARLKKLVAGKKLPAVAVEITEEHIARPVIDPAAQTEMRKLLQEVGFEVVDQKASGKQADITVSGEAFSEIAGRHGNLISCRARVEIKAVQNATGTLLLSDSQTDTAVDTAEHVAGKRALEKASSRLLDRLVSKIITE